jgi:DNA-directed RNA polymerase beta subunit
MNKKLEVMAGTDELGATEEFTWDLFPVVDPQQTTHLDTNGLPKVGTRIVPGMIVVGKIGKTGNYDASRQPTALEIHGLPFAELRSRYGSMWKDSSLYADSQTTGIVKEAFLEDCCGKRRAVIILERDDFSMPAVGPAQECAPDQVGSVASPRRR